MRCAICGPPQGAHPTPKNGSIVRMRQVLGGFPQLLFWTLLGLQTQVWSQTAATGALVGEVLDSSGRGIAHASVEVRNQDMAVSRSTSSDDEGHFAIPLLPPGIYRVHVAKAGYSQEQSPSVQVTVTERIRVSIPMKVTGATEHVEVHATMSELQSDSVALGRVVDANMIQALPLAARNFTQIVDLSPGVSTGVNNAGELRIGGTALSQIANSNDGARKSGGLGLVSMAERMYQVNGTLSIDSQPNAGTRIRACVPLAAQSSATNDAPRY